MTATTAAPEMSLTSITTIRIDAPTVAGFRSARPRVSLLDGFELTSDGRSLPLTMVLQRLVAYLALHDRPVRRLYLAGVLWGETSEEKANGSLRSALWRLRHAGVEVIEGASGHLWLAPAVAVDVREARRLMERLLDPSAFPDELRVGPERLTGDLLPGWYEDWVLTERERFHQLRLHGLESLCERLTHARRFGEAIQAGLAAVAADALRESARRVLVRAYLAEGNRVEAAREVARFRSLLRVELGVEPSPELTTLLVAPIR